MAELRFTENDGPIQLRLADHDAVVQGKGLISYVPRGGVRVAGRRRLHQSRLLKRLDIAVKIATLISFVGLIGLYVWRWYGGPSVPAFVSVASNVFSIAFLGSLISFGGVNILSLQAQSDANLERVEILARDCPFKALLRDPFDQIRQPGNPDFCIRCPLGIDTIGESERGFLMHNCAIYDEMHSKWRSLPEAERHLKHRWRSDEE